MRIVIHALLAAVLSPALLAQVSSPATPDTRPSPQGTAKQLAPSAVASTLPQLQQLVQNTRVDLARLRVEKWKTDSTSRQQAQENIDALQRNMSNALPEMIGAVQANPSSLAPSVRLYRNLNALYDVLSAVAESAGAFGPKDDYVALEHDVANLDTVRRSVADQLELLANSKDAQITRMEAQARQAATTAAAAPPKKVVVDDNEPAPKKPAKKKKPASPPPQ
jgi:hypothetical protein